MFKKKLVLMAVALAFSASTSANLSSEMNTFFNEIGAYSNVSPTQVLRGQTGTTFMGGSLYMRAPQRNYNVFSVAPPGIKAGCGGIDLFAGSFSFMNAEQFTALLQNLANNAVGVAFELAIESISPQLAGILKWAQDQASKLNNLNINSCQMATGLVMAAWPDKDAVQRFAARRGLDPQHNIATDSIKSWWNQLTNPPIQNYNETKQLVNADQRNKETIDNVNVVWNALNRIGLPDDSMKEFMMSLTGTVVIMRNKTDDSKPDIRYVAPPQKISFRTFIGDLNSPTTPVEVFACPDYECLNPGKKTINAVSFAQKTHAVLSSIVDKIRNRQAQSLTANEYKFMQGTFVPVWKIASYPDSDMAAQLVDAMSQVIAEDLAYTYFNEVSKELQKALSNSKSTDSATNKDQLDRMNDELKQLRTEAISMLQADLERLGALLGFQEKLARLYHQINLGMPRNLQVSLDTFGGGR